MPEAEVPALEPVDLDVDAIWADADRCRLCGEASGMLRGVLIDLLSVRLVRGRRPLVPADDDDRVTIGEGGLSEVVDP